MTKMKKKSKGNAANAQKLRAMVQALLISKSKQQKAPKKGRITG